MKVIAISDTRGLHSSLEIPDGGILVHAGDLTHHEALDDVLEFNDFLGRVSIVNWNSCPSSIGFGVHFHRKAHLLRKTHRACRWRLVKRIFLYAKDLQEYEPHEKRISLVTRPQSPGLGSKSKQPLQTGALHP